MMKKFFVLLSMVVLSGSVWATTFLPGSEDIPLMDGLHIQNSDNFLFDTPDGKVLVIKASSQNITADAFLSFYQKTLNQLGWKGHSLTQYARENDSLSLTVKQEKPLVVEFNFSSLE